MFQRLASSFYMQACTHNTSDAFKQRMAIWKDIEQTRKDNGPNKDMLLRELRNKLRQQYYNEVNG